MLHPFLLAFLLAVFSAATQAVSLFDGLRNANATKFAQWIESDAALVAIFTAPGIRTVFAPSDDVAEDFNKTGHRLLRMRDTSMIERGASIQCSESSCNSSTLGTPPGSVLGTKDGNDISSHASNEPNPLRSRHLSTHPIRIFSGLGNSVSVVKGDTPFDGGLIQTIDGFFTIPQSFSSTFRIKNLTNFNAGIQTAGLSSTVDDPAGLTVFATTNDVFQAGTGNSTSPTQLAGVLSNHIVPGFRGYRPLLVDGATLTTKAGTNLTVHIRNGEYFINEARIIASDLITTNGVAHVLDKVCHISLLLSRPGVNRLLIDSPTSTCGFHRLELVNEPN
ncbi:hypothetical protein GP486_004735 [Trichoglossum hirsutum]|uniref:FAS1 domain-containing protein n=1 Tax=Trichoglossum hirsutum TaxID=265104 RepID=A0A9P8LAS7_9PEZI|nr:hypothetical protein GP486_004735 [Trichoglossum hirsutum]